MELNTTLTPINNFSFNGNDIFTIKINDKVWFWGKQVAILLEYKRPNDAINSLVNPKHVLTLKQSAFGKLPKASELWSGNDHSSKTMIDVSGVFALILRSTLPQAEEFQDWVTDDVLPEIQRTGSFNSQSELPTNNLDKLVQLSANLVQSQQETQLKLDDNTSRIADLENSMTMDRHEAGKVHKLGKSVATKAMGGYESKAYKKLHHKVYSRLWINFNKHFGDLSSYLDLEHVKVPEAMYWLANKWYLDIDLQNEVDILNNQTDLNI